MIDTLVQKLNMEGLKLDKDDIIQLQDSINTGKFGFIVYKQKCVGFLSWRELYDEDGNLCVFLDNLIIEKEDRNKNNLLSLRKFFRDKYRGKVRFAYWSNDRRGRYSYVH